MARFSPNQLFCSETSSAPKVMSTDVTTQSFPLNECTKAQETAKPHDPTDKYGALISPRETPRLCSFRRGCRAGGRGRYTECRVGGYNPKQHSSCCSRPRCLLCIISPGLRITGLGVLVMAHSIRRVICSESQADLRPETTKRAVYLCNGFKK